MRGRRFRHGNHIRLRIRQGGIPRWRNLSWHRDLRRCTVREHSTAATCGYPQTRSCHRQHYRGEFAVRALLWLSRPGGWNSGEVVERDGEGSSGRRYRRSGRSHRDRIKIHQTCRRFAHLGRTTHHLGAKLGSETYPQGRSLRNSAPFNLSCEAIVGPQAPTPLSGSWKTTSTISPKLRSTFSNVAEAFCCFPRWIGR